MSRHKLDAKMHCKVPFGAYCEVHVDPDITNTMEPRTKWGICLGPTGNMQGSYKFLSLSTGKKVTKRKFTEMPMTDSVIKIIDSLGKKERCKMGCPSKTGREKNTHSTMRTESRVHPQVHPNSNLSETVHQHTPLMHFMNLSVSPLLT